MRRFWLVLTAAVLLLTFAPRADAAAYQLKLTISDPRSTPVAGARVTVYSEGSEKPLQIQTTSAEGTATFSPLEAGRYRVEVLAPGFAPRTSTFEIPATQQTALRLDIAVPPQTVQVTATRTPATAEKTGTAVEQLGSQELETMQPLAAPDALRFLPGVVVNTVGRLGGQASLFVRGGESRYNKVIVDGVPINDPGGIFDFGVVPLTAVERLEFVRGTQSVLYGSDAMTSVVQLWSATGHARTPELRFGADGGSFSTARGYVSVAGARGCFDYNLLAEQDNSNGQGINDAYSNSTQGANVGVVLSSRALMRLRVRHSNSRSGVQGEWNFNGQPLLAPDSDAFARQNNLLGSVSLTLAAPARWQHRFSSYDYNHTRTNQDTFPDPGRGCDPTNFNLTDCFFASPSAINRAGFEYQGDWSPRTWAHTTLGYNFEDENGVFDARFLTADFSQFPPPTFIGTSHTRGLRRNHGAYAEQMLLWRRFTLLAGARLEHNESFGNKGVPRATLTVLAARGGEVLSGTRLRFAYSEGIKEPRFEESFGVIGTFPASPNPDLRPEENRSLEAGLQQGFLGGRYSFSATYYNNLFRDQIQFQPGPNFVGGHYVNIAKALAHGAEIELHGRMAHGLLLSAGYVYTSSQVLSNPLAFDPFAPGEPLIRRPKHSGTVLLNYFGKRWGGELGGSFVGRRADSDFLDLGVNHTAGCARVDLGGWVAVNRYVTAYTKLENALNRRYEEVAGYPALRANFRAGLRFRLGGE